MKKLEDLKQLIDTNKKSRLAVAGAEEENILIAVDKAYRDLIIEPILVGDSIKIKEYIEKNALELTEDMIVNSANFEEL